MRTGYIELCWSMELEVMDLGFLTWGMWFPKNTKYSNSLSKCKIALQFRRTVAGAPNVS